ncbi:MAG: hypothetical protein ABIQ57_17905, partial [Candidatus Kapaibacterium sp.]
WQGTLTSATLGNATFIADGNASFETESVTPASQPAGNTQKPQTLSVTTPTPNLGIVTWRFSDDAATPTAINAIQNATDFPATSDIYFTPEATISSQPGITYKASSEVHLQNNNLTSFNPQVNEPYTLASGPIDFYDEATGTVVFTIDASSITVGQAASVLRPNIGTKSDCPVQWGGTFTSATLGNLNFAADGKASFETKTVTALDQPAGNTQAAVTLDARVQTATLGTITWRFVPTATATPTAINANQSGADFPATSDIYFTPEATISSQPGVIYRATSEVHLQSTSLTSFNPQVNENYTLFSGPIDFYDVKSGQVIFTINATSIVVGATPSVLRPVIGTRSDCPIQWGGSFTSTTLGNLTFNANGNASFQTETVTALTQPAGNTQSPVSLQANVPTPTIGTITWNFAPGIASTPTAINANQPGADFPATSDIYFTPEATISSQPGVVYRATSEVHLQNTNLTSFGPQINENYTLFSGPIDFFDVRTGQVVFTINATTIIVGNSAAPNAPPDPNGLH